MRWTYSYPNPYRHLIYFQIGNRLLEDLTTNNYKDIVYEEFHHHFNDFCVESEWYLTK
jgi:hypothetical protein